MEFIFVKSVDMIKTPTINNIPTTAKAIIPLLRIYI